MTINDIPQEDLIDMLRGAVWHSGNREEFGTNQGCSLDVQEETCHRDVLYRNERLFQTPEEAILAHWRRHYAATHTPGKD